MKLFGLLLLSGIAAATGFQVHAPFREKVRTFVATQGDEDRISAYRCGRDLLLSQWAVAPDAKLPAWGDTPAIDAAPMEGDVWQARGYVDVQKEATRVRVPWLAVFNRSTNELLLAAAGPKMTPRLDLLIKSGARFPSTIQEMPQWAKRNQRSPLIAFLSRYAREQADQNQEQNGSPDWTGGAKKSGASAFSESVRTGFGWEPRRNPLDR